MVLGDFNVNCDEPSSTQAIKQYTNHIRSVSCTQLINQPIRITQTSSTVIDHIYVNSSPVSHVTPTIVTKIFLITYPFLMNLFANNPKIL